MFTHYVKHDANLLAWSSCHCRATRSHFVGEEVYPPPPSPLGVHMSDIANKRKAVASVYQSFTWAQKVKAMPDAQVVALFLKFQREGKIR